MENAIEVIFHPDNSDSVNQDLLLQVKKTADQICLAFEKKALSCTVIICDDAIIKELNLKFRGFDKSTDVLSFESEADENDPEKYIGDIFINLKLCEQRALCYSTELVEEIIMLLVHGLCHLNGFDHADMDSKLEMGDEEMRLLTPFGYSSLLMNKDREEGL